MALGAGRAREGEPIDHGVGLLVHVKRGASVEKGQPLVTIVHRDRGLEQTSQLLREAYQIV